MTFKRYDVYWVNLEPVRGSEMAKTRPAVIVSLDVLNQALNTVVICPLTTKVHPGWRCRLAVKVGGKTGEIAADQLRVVSKQRLAGRIGSLATRDVDALRRLLSEMYGEG